MGKLFKYINTTSVNQRRKDVEIYQRLKIFYLLTTYRSVGIMTL